MRYYFAPMEGLTDSVYRRVHHQYFGGVDRYYMPFLSPTVHRELTPREARELPRADSVNFHAVPQLLTKVPADFLWAAEKCRELGYEEVNLNAGCPSGTVTAKGKGSGMLRDPEALDAFLNEVFSKATLPISVKTRIGFEDPSEFPAILEIYNRYPIAELTVHPRVRKQFYSGDADLAMFAYAAENSKVPLVYNGDITNTEGLQQIQTRFPQVQAVMIGRGLIGNPGMLMTGGTDISSLEGFMDTLLEEYLVVFGGSRNAMFRLKENWNMVLSNFGNCEKLGKRLRKTTDLAEFRAITREILHTCPWKGTCFTL
ncbi:MAG: tRNA-dihydrouridine synthase family protein [Oscillospiraceae bacterium]|nr:tRNA-dihydrouridine synthase family protein [Oscillospiraceae bacterium]